MNYYELEVVLHSGAFLPEGWAPGRVFAVPGTCRLSELGAAIDAAFGPLGPWPREGLQGEGKAA